MDDQRSALLAYLVCTALGMAMLFAYNSFVSSPDYIKHYYQYGSNDPNEAPLNKWLWENMMSLVVILTMVPNVLGQLFLLTSWGRGLRLWSRIVFSMAVLTLSIVVVALAPIFRPGQAASAAALLFAVGMSGASAAFFQSSTFALSALLGERHTQGVMLGQGISGTVASLLQILSKGVAGGGSFTDTKNQAYMFFGIGIGWMVVCLVVAVAMPRIRFLASKVPEFRPLKRRGEEFDLLTPRANSSVSIPPDPVPAQEDDDPPTGADDAPRSVIQLIISIANPMLAVFLVYAVSLFLFPAVVSRASSDDWFGILVVFLFNIGDTIGRFLCRFPFLHIRVNLLLPAAIVRFIFVPLIMLCVAPKAIQGVAVPYVTIGLCGLTNGYIGSLCMMYGPSEHTGVRDRERAVAGSAMSLSLLMGCSIGSLVALLVNSLT